MSVQNERRIRVKTELSHSGRYGVSLTNSIGSATRRVMVAKVFLKNSKVIFTMYCNIHLNLATKGVSVSLILASQIRKFVK
jgi:hypothetical protein